MKTFVFLCLLLAVSNARPRLDTGLIDLAATSRLTSSNGCAYCPYGSWDNGTDCKAISTGCAAGKFNANSCTECTANHTRKSSVFWWSAGQGKEFCVPNGEAETNFNGVNNCKQNLARETTNVNGANCDACPANTWDNGTDCVNVQDSCKNFDGTNCTECLAGYTPKTAAFYWSNGQNRTYCVRNNSINAVNLQGVNNCKVVNNTNTQQPANNNNTTAPANTTTPANNNNTTAPANTNNTTTPVNNNNTTTPANNNNTGAAAAATGAAVAATGAAAAGVAAATNSGNQPTTQPKTTNRIKSSNGCEFCPAGSWDTGAGCIATSINCKDGQFAANSCADCKDGTVGASATFWWSNGQPKGYCRLSTQAAASNLNGVNNCKQNVARENLNGCNACPTGTWDNGTDCVNVQDGCKSFQNGKCQECLPGYTERDAKFWWSNNDVAGYCTSSWQSAAVNLGGIDNCRTKSNTATSSVATQRIKGSNGCEFCPAGSWDNGTGCQATSLNCNNTDFAANSCSGCAAGYLNETAVFWWSKGVQKSYCRSPNSPVAANLNGVNNCKKNVARQNDNGCVVCPDKTWDNGFDCSSIEDGCKNFSGTECTECLPGYTKRTSGFYWSNGSNRSYCTSSWQGDAVNPNGANNCKVPATNNNNNSNTGAAVAAGAAGAAAGAAAAGAAVAANTGNNAPASGQTGAQTAGASGQAGAQTAGQSGGQTAVTVQKDKDGDACQCTSANYWYDGDNCTSTSTGCNVAVDGQGGCSQCSTGYSRKTDTFWWNKANEIGYCVKSGQSSAKGPMKIYNAQDQKCYCTKGWHKDGSGCMPNKTSCDDYKEPDCKDCDFFSWKTDYTNSDGTKSDYCGGWPWWVWLLSILGLLLGLALLAGLIGLCCKLCCGKKKGSSSSGKKKKGCNCYSCLKISPCCKCCKK